MSSLIRDAIRDSRYSGCITTAAFYLRELAIGVGKAEAAKGYGSWRKACREASKMLVMHNGQLGFEVKAGELASAEAELPAGVIAEVTSRVTTRDKDWDGDIVHPEGLIFDPNGPMLWMHSQNMPIGRLVQVVDQDETVARCKFIVADTELGRDAVALFRVGALRKSIGFRVLEAEPLGFTDAGGGKQVPTGFDIKRAVVLETSAVAIPANPNAQVERMYAKEYEAIRGMASRKELKSPVVAKWVESIYDNRMRVFSGVTLAKGAEVEKTKVAEAVSGGEEVEIDFEKSLSFGMGQHADGSYEQAIDGVNRSCKGYICRNDKECDMDHNPLVMATYKGKSLVCMHKWDESGMLHKRCYKVDYKMNGNDAECVGCTPIQLSHRVLEMADKKCAELRDLKKKEAQVSAEIEEAGDGYQDAKRILAKMVSGEIESDDSLRGLVRSVADFLERTREADALSGVLAQV